LTDGTLEASEVFVSEIINPEEGWLVPVCASVPCRSYGRVILSPKTRPFRGESATPIEQEMEVIGRDEVNVEGSIAEPVEGFGDYGTTMSQKRSDLRE